MEQEPGCVGKAVCCGRKREKQAVVGDSSPSRAQHGRIAVANLEPTMNKGCHRRLIIELLRASNHVLDLFVQDRVDQLSDLPIDLPLSVDRDVKHGAQRHQRVAEPAVDLSFLKQLHKLLHLVLWHCVSEDCNDGDGTNHVAAPFEHVDFSRVWQRCETRRQQLAQTRYPCTQLSRSHALRDMRSRRDPVPVRGRAATVQFCLDFRSLVFTIVFLWKKIASYPRDRNVHAHVLFRCAHGTLDVLLVVQENPLGAKNCC
mmetsp:Transcript_62136/g.146067  ORF Transcript_62136/g.146067 Transcript_62136/m.146067 type:complete len:258 (+) Transcript_62136:1176-1949(+)